ncbi:hypothetical protein BH20ACT23_BH20ACT23_26590 [soil metagenome]
MGDGGKLGLKLLALTVAFGASVASLPPPVEASNQKRYGHQVAPGVRLRLYRLSGPNKVRVLSFNIKAKATIDTVLASNNPGRERVASMAGRTRAIAAINGDYARPSGRPMHTFARDGRLDLTPAMISGTGVPYYGRNFSVDTLKENVFMTHPWPRSWVWVLGDQGDVSYRVERVNDPSIHKHAKREIRAFTSAARPSELPPHGGCYVHLRPTGPPRATDATHAPRVRGRTLARVGVERKHVVNKRRCNKRRIAPKGGITLYSPLHGVYADALRSMKVGRRVFFGWSLGWPNVFDTVGGNPTLIEDGVVQKQSIYDGSSFATGRHPRTAVAFNARTKSVSLVTVDGRQPNYSRGMSLGELTRFCRKRLGATDALNLDGGGSTTMVVKGKIRGRPSDGSERAVSSALVVLRGRDPGEPRLNGLQSRISGLTPENAEPPVMAGAISPYEDMVQDPASVGGLAVWLDQQGHDLPEFLEQAADDFRGSRGPITD